MDPDNGLRPQRCQAIIWTNDGFWTLGNNFQRNVKIQQFSLNKMYLKMSSKNIDHFVSLNVWSFGFISIIEIKCSLCPSVFLVTVPKTWICRKWPKYQRPETCFMKENYLRASGAVFLAQTGMIWMCSLALNRELINDWEDGIDGLVQEKHNSIANALELCLSCANTSI